MTYVLTIRLKIKFPIYFYINIINFLVHTFPKASIAYNLNCLCCKYISNGNISETRHSTVRRQSLSLYANTKMEKRALFSVVFIFSSHKRVIILNTNGKLFRYGERVRSIRMKYWNGHKKPARLWSLCNVCIEYFI